MTMKTGRAMSCCVALLLALTSVSAVQRELDSINDLKEINFGQSVPKHSLLLLYWFANAVDINGTNVMRLTFDPESRAYGSHHYGNFEGLLDNVRWGNVNYRYYTIGSLNQESTMQLPPYVVRPPATEYVGSNRDRIIIRVREPNTGRQAQQMIDQVYITQHLGNQPEYDPDHTYRITPNLLRQIREFSVRPHQLQQLRTRFGSNANVVNIINTWAGLAGLGLLLYIVIQERYSFTQQNSTLQSLFTPQSHVTTQCNFTPQSHYGHANMPNNGGNDDLVKYLLIALVLIGFVIFMFAKSSRT